jgi:hemoglobin
MTDFKEDIKHRKDLHLFVTKFYKKLLMDTELKPFFEHLVQQDHLEQHLEIITDFWNSMLFNTLDYQRNAMQPHLDLNKIKHFEKHHFKAWLKHFNTTMDENFKGERAEMAKTRALSIATVMEIKMINS